MRGEGKKGVEERDGEEKGVVVGGRGCGKDTIYDTTQQTNNSAKTTSEKKE